ncbi:MAG: FtsK/SpoIIIE domain-containing protein [Acidobacteriota bacterium]
MAVTLSVSEVRAAIYRAAQTDSEPGAGATSTVLLGQLFHEVFAALIGPDDTRNFHAAIDEIEPQPEEWVRALIKHAYQHLVGPRLRQQQALLHHRSEQVLTLWDSVQELCVWLADLLWQLRAQGDDELSLSKTLRVEPSLSCELLEPGWTDAVRLTGIADALWRLPESRAWCVVELKTGSTAPEADLAQACLYHLILAAVGEPDLGTLALIRFSPQREEQLFAAVQLTETQARLKELVGRLAGVLPDAQTEKHQPPALSPSLSPSLSKEHQQLGEQILHVLREYGAEVSPDGATVMGPTFLRFPVTLGARVKLRAVEQLAKELQVRLRLDAPPRIGTENGSVVIDVQRPDRQAVLFAQICGQLPVGDPLLGNAQTPLGVDLTGSLRLLDFAQPEDAHLLVAGTTGSGKSEWLRTALAGLLLTNTPDTLRLLLIDPKRNAFHALRNSPFLWRPLVFPDEQPETRPVVRVLQELADEMERRYQLLGEHGDDSLASYVRRIGQPLPRIFCVCDEYADLILADRTTRRAIEQQITRLGQKARAAGIHLILATQQPSREIIRGVLDANIPARVGLKMQKAIESKMLLNFSGAEMLLGRGDLLFRDVGEPVRLQGAYLPPEEAEQIFG